TLIGSWPITEERLLAYLEKAEREAKLHSSWHRPNEAYEGAVAEFARAILKNESFVGVLEGLVSELRGPAERNSLAQLVLKMTVPGVPDVYQGQEVFRYDLTDPDNRREIDFTELANKLSQVEKSQCGELLRKNDADVRKLYVTYKLLNLRREFPEWFGREAAYTPVHPLGEHADRVFAFMRGAHVLVAVPRLSASLGDNWGDTRIELPPGAWENVLCGVTARRGTAAELFAELPVAVLVQRPV
ncbi:MAG TPA: hypothetical protein VHZ95_09695, partial [Polyangiales bacterium]|nr:hypothetical protein [Polyangiales bacterium]